VTVVLRLTLACWLAISGGWASTAGAGAPESPYFEFTQDEGVFALFAALNAAGYDVVANYLGMHPLRVKVRESLRREANGPELPHAFEHAAHALPRGRPWVLGSVLLTQGPPDFAPAERESMSRESRQLLAQGSDLLVALRTFYRQMDLRSLWAETRRAQEAWSVSLAERADSLCTCALSLTGIDTPEVPVRVIVIPTVLDAYWTTHDYEIERGPVLVLGPSVDADPSLLVQTLLRAVLDRAAADHYLVIREKRALFDLVGDRPDVLSSCRGFHELVTRCLAWAIWLRVCGEDLRWVDGELDRLSARGFLLVCAFYDEVGRSRWASPSEAVEQAVGSIDVERERRRWEESRAVRERWGAIFEADLKRRTGQYSEAQAMYETVLEADAENARALFGIGSLLHDLGRADEAKAAFERALRARPDEPAIEAWSWLRIGWIEDLAGRREAALDAYRRALAVGTNERNVAEIARRGLETPFEAP